jgi:hypothetical protein
MRKRSYQGKSLPKAAQKVGRDFKTISQDPRREFKPAQMVLEGVPLIPVVLVCNYGMLLCNIKLEDQWIFYSTNISF